MAGIYRRFRRVRHEGILATEVTEATEMWLQVLVCGLMRMVRPASFEVG